MAQINRLETVQELFRLILTGLKILVDTAPVSTIVLLPALPAFILNSQPTVSPAPFLVTSLWALSEFHQ
jgi:hypothetical protein